MEDRLYFAYGSNIDLTQMAIRCPAAQVVGPATLDDYELLFRGCRNGEGLATIAPHSGMKVHGLLWKLTPECERALDHYEGYPGFYRKEAVTVRDKSGQEAAVMAYVMTDSRSWNYPALPHGAYYYGILDGYRQNGLPVDALQKAVEHTKQEICALPCYPEFGKNASSKSSRRKNNHER